MTAGERSLWLAVYAASWHVTMGGPVGAPTDWDRARWCAGQASRAVDALKAVTVEASTPIRGEAAEVLR